MLEKQIEEYLYRQMKKHGGAAYKFTSPSRRSVPDRICIFPNGTLVFVEVKAPGKKSTEKQVKEQSKLRVLGQQVEVIDNHDSVDEFIAAHTK